MLMPIHRYLFFVIGVLIFVTVLLHIRKRKLTTEFSLLWILTAFFLILQVFPINLFGFVCRKIHLQPVSLVFSIFILFAVAILYYFSLLISKLWKSHKIMTQKLALIELELAEKKKT
jgi:hypothetical protein